MIRGAPLHQAEELGSLHIVVATVGGGGYTSGVSAEVNTYGSFVESELGEGGAFSAMLRTTMHSSYHTCQVGHLLALKSYTGNQELLDWF
eukprot:SAG11_NODE_1491_length_4810_cov_1.999363_3_plen_90_part_00